MNQYLSYSFPRVLFQNAISACPKENEFAMTMPCSRGIMGQDGRRGAGAVSSEQDGTGWGRDGHNGAM